MASSEGVTVVTTHTGKIQIDIGGFFDSGQTVSTQADGTIWIGGYQRDGLGTSHYAVARLKPDGSLDTTFSDDGKVILPDQMTPDAAHSMAVQDDGKLVVTRATADGHFTVSRLNTDGSLDTTFSTDGTTQITAGINGSFSGTVVQDDGKILLSGHNGDTFTLARLNTHLSLQRLCGLSL